MLSIIVFIGLVAFTVRQLIVEYRTERTTRATGARALPTTPAAFRFDPCTELPAGRAAAARSPEGAIVAGLLDGRIDREQYRRAMAQLAATGTGTQPVSLDDR